MTLSALIIARDEEGNIVPCIQSLAGLADEVLVAVDSRTADRTLELARDAGAKAFSVEWQGYGPTKNLALERAAGDWVLWIDADERATPELSAEIRKCLASSGELAAFAVPRQAYFLGRWIRHCGWYPGYVARLFRRGRARFDDKAVHEGLQIDGPVGRLARPLLHFTDPDLRHYLEKFNLYTTLAAQELNRRGRRARLSDILVRPPAFFAKMYLLKLGFLDGLEGLALCLLSAHYVLVKYLKLWELHRDRA